MTVTWVPGVSAAGWHPPLLLAAALAATSFAAALAYWWYERRSRVTEVNAAQASDGAFRWRDVLHFSPAYWTLVALCVLWYAGILAFRSTFSIKYFQHVFGLPLDEAGQMNSVIFLTSIFSTPLLGWLCDRTGRYSGILVLGSLLLPAAFVSLQFPRADPHVGMVLIGMSYSLVGAAMWPMASKLVEAGRFGTMVLGTVRVRWRRDQDYYDRDAWRGTWALDGGVIAQQASHHVDLLRWFMGPIRHLQCQIATRLMTIEVEDTAAAQFTFASGALGEWDANRYNETTALNPRYTFGEMLVEGDAGSIRLRSSRRTRRRALGWMMPRRSQRTTRSATTPSRARSSRSSWM